ncbi:endonuclease/exonuclease/phosphatase family protein, partial [Dietzia sp.]|uniref:endonuclease/exonuclease/phosphatase family protein n=1 Tax=Dietzia sp. TaxID=1871616 RepID=UPI002FD9D92E
MSVKVATVNVNGIRAAVKERNERNPGMLPWLEESGVDVVCMQEVRATEEQAEKALEPALENGWHLVVAPAAAKGRAGVGLLSKEKPEDVVIGYGDPEFADSGRYIEAVFSGPGKKEKVRIASLYLPSGSAGTPKQDEKERFMDTFRPFLEDRAA